MLQIVPKWRVEFRHAGNEVRPPTIIFIFDTHLGNVLRTVATISLPFEVVGVSVGLDLTGAGQFTSGINGIA